MSGIPPPWSSPMDPMMRRLIMHPGMPMAMHNVTPPWMGAGPGSRGAHWQPQPPMPGPNRFWPASEAMWSPRWEYVRNFDTAGPGLGYCPAYFQMGEEKQCQESHRDRRSDRPAMGTQPTTQVKPTEGIGRSDAPELSSELGHEDVENAMKQWWEEAHQRWRYNLALAGRRGVSPS